MRLLMRVPFREMIIYIASGLLILSLILLPFSYSYFPIKIPINCLYIALITFMLCFYNDLKDIRILKIPLIFLAIVIVMAYISLFYADNSIETKRAIRQYLLEPILFMLFSFLLVRRFSQRQLKILLFMLCAVFLCFVAFSLYDFIINGGARLGYRAKLPRYHTPATVYAFYLLFAFALFLGGFIKAKGRLKIAFLLFVLLGALAIIANGGRFAFLAMIVMALAPFIFFTFHFKRLVLLMLCAICIVGVSWLYFVSKDWSWRFNLHYALNNITTIYHTNPSAMGKYLKGGCEKYTICHSDSLISDSNLMWEFSSLDRISKLKSTLLAIRDNPLRPNGYHFQQFPFNIKHIFGLDSAFCSFSLKKYNDAFIPSGAHNHNYIASIFFELGLFGFIGFVGFSLCFPVILYKQKIALKGTNNINEILISGIGIGTLGLMVANMFDCIPVRDGQLTLFILYGIFFGARHSNNGK